MVVTYIFDLLIRTASQNGATKPSSIRNRFRRFQSMLAVCNGGAESCARRRPSGIKCMKSCGFTLQIVRNSKLALVPIAARFLPLCSAFFFFAFPTELGTEVDGNEDHYYSSLASSPSFLITISSRAPLHPDLENDLLLQEVFTQEVVPKGSCGRPLTRLLL